MCGVVRLEEQWVVVGEEGCLWREGARELKWRGVVGVRETDIARAVQKKREHTQRHSTDYNNATVVCGDGEC